MSAATEDKRWARFVTPGAVNECWEWQGWRSPQGYGRFNIGGRQIPASRAAAIRAGMDVQTALPDADRARVYLEIARTEAESVAHLRNHYAHAAAGYAARASDGAASMAAAAAAAAAAAEGGDRLARAHRIIDQFEDLTGVRATPVPAEVAETALTRMAARS